LIRVENRKNKRRTTKNQPIPIEKEKGIAVFLHRYIKPLQKDALLFPFSSQRATQIINQVSGFNVHFIRHIRATHLVDLYDFNEQALIKFMGWTNSQPATRYIELKSSGIMRQFYKGG
jgi:integrase